MDPDKATFAPVRSTDISRRIRGASCATACQTRDGPASASGSRHFPSHLIPREIPIERVRRAEVRERYADARVQRAEVVPVADRDEQPLPGTENDLLARQVLEIRKGVEVGVLGIDG